jgi:hypothetical protein
VRTRKSAGKSPAAIPASAPDESPGESATLFDSMADDAYVTLHRRDDISKEWVGHGRLSPTEATEEEIMRQFGGGTYRCQEKVRDETGAWRIGRTRTIRIAGPYRPPTGALPGTKASEPVPAPAPVPAAPASNTGDIIGAGILQLFQAAQAQQGMMTQMFAQMSQSQATLLQAVLKDGNRGPDITGIITALAPVVQKFLEQPKQERDPLEMLKAVGEIIRSNTGKQSDVADTIAAMRDLLEMKEMLSPSGGDTDPLLGSVPKLVEVLVEEQQERKRAKSAPAPAPAPTQAVPGRMGAVDPSMTQRLEVPVWVRVLRNESKRLVAAASSGRDPSLVAEIAWEWAPAGIKPAISEFFGMDDAEDKIKQVVPQLASYPEWVSEFVEEARALIFGEVAEEGPTDPAQLELGPEEEGHGDSSE